MRRTYRFAAAGFVTQWHPHSRSGLLFDDATKTQLKFRAADVATTGQLKRDDRVTFDIAPDAVSRNGRHRACNIRLESCENAPADGSPSSGNAATQSSHSQAAIQSDEAELRTGTVVSSGETFSIILDDVSGFSVFVPRRRPKQSSPASLPSCESTTQVDNAQYDEESTAPSHRDSSMNRGGAAGRGGDDEARPASPDQEAPVSVFRPPLQRVTLTQQVVYRAVRSPQALAERSPMVATEVGLPPGVSPFFDAFQTTATHDSNALPSAQRDAHRSTSGRVTPSPPPVPARFSAEERMQHQFSVGRGRVVRVIEHSSAAPPTNDTANATAKGDETISYRNSSEKGEAILREEEDDVVPTRQDTRGTSAALREGKQHTALVLDEGSNVLYYVRAFDFAAVSPGLQEGDFVTFTPYHSGDKKKGPLALSLKVDSSVPRLVKPTGAKRKQSTPLKSDTHRRSTDTDNRQPPTQSSHVRTSSGRDAGLTYSKTGNVSSRGWGTQEPNPSPRSGSGHRNSNSANAPSSSRGWHNTKSSRQHGEEKEDSFTRGTKHPQHHARRASGRHDDQEEYQWGARPGAVRSSTSDDRPRGSDVFASASKSVVENGALKEPAAPERETRGQAWSVEEFGWSNDDQDDRR